jgi:hypothetical protein
VPHLSGRAACANPREAGACFSDTLPPSAILVDIAMAIVFAVISRLRCVGVRVWRWPRIQHGLMQIESGLSRRVVNPRWDPPYFYTTIATYCLLHYFSVCH